jgi:cell division protein FtsB
MVKRSEAKRKQQRYINIFWVTLTVVIAICTIFVSISTIGNMFRTRSHRREVESKIAILERKIEGDSIFIERITNDPEFMEEYARETFYMQRKGETVYILEN